MDLVKKNPLLFGLCGLCGLVFCAGAFFTFTAKGKSADAERRVESAQRQLAQVVAGIPAPSSENLEASEQNVAELKAKLGQIHDDLQRGSDLTVSTDGVRVMSSIQKFITDFQNTVEKHTVIGSKGEIVPEPITTPENFAFGFEKYIGESVLPEDPEVVAELDQQRQILTFLLNQLIASDPKGISSVRREIIEDKNVDVENGRRSASNKSVYVINPAVSARVPDAIDTVAFEITFSGKTFVLRDFLNRLKEFELPIVVRSVEAARAEKAAVNQPSSGGGNSLNSIFGSFGGASDSNGGAEENTAPKKTIVVDENDSTFTVTLEFIEVVLPSEVNDSDPA